MNECMIKKRISLFIYLVLVTCVLQSYGQSPQQIDSLQKIINIEKSVDLKIQYVNKLARIYIDQSDSLNAITLLDQALKLCKNATSTFPVIYTYSNWGIYYIRRSEFEKADSLFALALKYHSNGNSDKDKMESAVVMGDISTTYSRKGDYQKAIDFKLRAIEALSDLHTDDAIKAKAGLFGGIANLYADQKQYDKAAKYDKIMIDLWNAKPDVSVDEGAAYTYLCDDYINLNELDSAKKYIAVAKTIADTLNSPSLYCKYYNYSAKIYFGEKKYEQSLTYALKAQEYALQAKSIMSQLVAHLTIAQSYKELSQPEKALPYLLEELSLAEKIQSDRERKVALLELAKVSYLSKNYKQAYDYYHAYSVLNDSIQKKADIIKLNEIEEHYQSEKKQLQIMQLQKEKQIQQLTIKQKNNWLYFSGLGILGLCIIVILMVRSFRRKQQLAQQQIIQMQQEKQLQAVDNILQTQEQERSRIAKDLHDGVGGLLSSVKLNLSTMKGNVIIPEQDVQLFNKSITQLDNAIAEMRRVAHNMMPEALVKFGLSEAVNDYCEGINESSTIKIKYTQLGITQPLEKPTEVILYRIIQELTTNAVKYAGAKNILIQLSRNENLLNLTVEDDGQGFDTAQLSSTKGTGLQNVQSRVDYLKGTFTIESEKGKGTTANIELPI